ncbi:hypothetical protein [uncultured Sphingomonas sp.]|uniref:hypothetical protein n=1 Tax=uncultured Sphingomonas sp. TaxID=158754 RepID=UPI0025E6713E|nr:hypothetical protein [uncultured Sphingomonas sp.]
MSSNIEGIVEAIQENASIAFRKTATGKTRLCISRGEGEASSPIPQISTQVVDKYLFEAASVDATLFGAMEAMAAALNTLAHLRESLIELVSEGGQWFDSWAEYALEELEGVDQALASLYRVCTGKNHVPHRVR